jgi:hypothetical protein
MRRDAIWEDGPVKGALLVGVPAGLFFGLLQFFMEGSALGALAAGVFFGVWFGVIMTWWARRQWRRGAELTPADRAAVARAVRKGEDVGDARLDDAVVDYAGVVRRVQELDTRYRWVMWAIAASTVALAIGATVEGSTREAVVWWLLTVFWAVNLTWLVPRRRARTLENARRAEEAARSTPPAPSEA